MRIFISWYVIYHIFIWRNVATQPAKELLDSNQADMAIVPKKKTPVQLPTCHQLCHFPPRICVSKGICVSMGGRPGTPALQGCLETGTMSELSHHFCSPAHGSKALYPTSMEIRVSFFWVCLQLLTIGFIQLIHLTLNGLADVERSDKPKTK